MSRLRRRALIGAASEGGPPPSGTWVAYSSFGVNGDSGITDNSTIRQGFRAEHVVACTKVRVTLQASSASPMQIGKIAVGIRAATGDIYDYASAPVVGSFSGSAGVTIPAGGSIVSDPMDITVASGDALVIGIYMVAGRTFYGNYYDGAYKMGSGDEVETVDASGYTVTSSNHFAITKIEYFVPD